MNGGCGGYMRQSVRESMKEEGLNGPVGRAGRCRQEESDLEGRNGTEGRTSDTVHPDSVSLTKQNGR